MTKTTTKTIKANDKTPDPKSKRLKEKDWIVICELWEMGETSLSELSAKFGISNSALSQGLKRRGVTRGRKAYLGREPIADKIRDENMRLVEDIFNFKKRFIGYGDYIASTAVQIIREAVEADNLGNKRPDLATLGEAAKIVSKVRDDLFHLYNMYDKEEASSQEDYSFNVGVYSEKDIEQLREAQKEIDEHLETSEDDDFYEEDEE